ncbi:hypothetical protein PTTG_12516 [Puccinia triticina 1-1 BBBD Race 1]|uniref:CobW C-terminal domain-containing protein n=2 Tax=Puccinia triticina TaxID=208348 RepID=A0A180H133_PUCT1|nr:uncharacterized protein PtA15_5A576 [Puccinia triticina]OAV98756.1 hypothetical protein PTTG_12516 [Puccinia triticina 1-1 BBBD Race 1]WAQ85003.1 hypothetical protein PtA15_5A576 [Puccinia triticina]WAR58341.1 hypothetical protein PtB15_5B575 [Puccinia triticina]
MADLKKVPVTILSGQLGSGKSTLLRRLLTNQSQLKIAIVMNEFAQTASIEGKSIQLTVANEGTQVQEWLELDNGCLCCSAQDQGVLAIESLMQRRGTFDHIIVETTGIADPSQIALLFWIDSALESLLYLDGIVTVVDCAHLEKQLEEEATANSGTVTKQIAVADSLYLSKIDLVSESRLEPLKRLIDSLNDSALLSQSDDDLEMVLPKVLSLDSFSTYRGLPQSLATPERNTENVDSSLMARLTRPVGNSTDPSFRTTHDSFSTITINLPAFANVNTSDSKFDRTFRKLLWEGILGEEGEPRPAEPGSEIGEPLILRAKGLLKDNDGNWFILQAVRETYEIQPVHPDVLMDEHEHPKLVLIGKGLDTQLEQRFLKEIS